jgi:hypothetical protein
VTRLFADAAQQTSPITRAGRTPLSGTDSQCFKGIGDILNLATNDLFPRLGKTSYVNLVLWARIHKPTIEEFMAMLGTTLVHYVRRTALNKRQGIPITPERITKKKLLDMAIEWEMAAPEELRYMSMALDCALIEKIFPPLFEFAKELILKVELE